MWQHVHTRARGTSHVASGAPCQDHETFRVVDDADGGDAAIGVVCDGAGSARFSELGAEIVANAIKTVAGAFVSQSGTSAITTDVMREWVVEARRRVEAQAEAEGAESRDFACTLLFAIAAERRTYCGQIGDGAIVLKEGENLTVPIWPANGEYANQTYFVTQEASEALLYCAMNGAVTDFVLFSDGLQRLALNEAEKSAHAAFINPLFTTVRAADSTDATTTSLTTFLQSDRVNQKTDDDKSIVIACRIA